MSCINPLQIKIKGEWRSVSCGHCQNCIIKKKSQLEFLAQKEAYKCYEKGKGCSFVTLTYTDNFVPITRCVDGTERMTLRKKDVQDFLKRLRATKEYYKDTTTFKTIYCGEYGENYGRPHAHIAFLGLSDAQIAAYTKKTWKQGLVDIGTLGNGGIRYIIDYMQKANWTKSTRDYNEALGIENPFLNHSIEIGKEWIIENEQKIIDNNFELYGHLMPKYVIEWVCHRNGIDWHKVILDKIKKKWNNSSSWRELELEESLLKEKWLIEGMRSQGQQIEKWQIQQRKWAKVRSYHDRNYWQPLIEKCL